MKYKRYYMIQIKYHSQWLSKLSRTASTLQTLDACSNAFPKQLKKQTLKHSQ